MYGTGAFIWCRCISPNRSSSWVYCRAPTKIELRLGLELGYVYNTKWDQAKWDDTRHILTYGRPKKWYRKNDERQNRACQRGKKRQSKSLLLVRLSRKRLGEMRLSEMLPNRSFIEIKTDSGSGWDLRMKVPWNFCRRSQSHRTDKTATLTPRLDVRKAFFSNRVMH